MKLRNKKVKMGVPVCTLALGLLIVCFMAGSAPAQSKRDTIIFGLVGQLVTNVSTDLDDTSGEWPTKMSIYEGLVRYKPGTLEAEPCLATSWEVSKDGKEMTFHLRKGVQFHKGFGEFTAEDVKASYDRILQPKVWTYLAEIGEDWNALDHVEVVDKYTVKLFLKEPDYTWFTYVLPHYTGLVTSKKALEKYGVEGSKTHAIGTGPYELDHWTPMDELVLNRFDDYWGGKASIAKVKVISFGDEVAMAKALKGGQIDVMRPSWEDIEDLKKDPKIKIKVFGGTGFGWVGMNVRKPPTDNIKVRQAISHAINVDEILKFIRSEVTEDPTTLRAYSPMPAIYPEACPKEICPPVEYNPQKAKELLKEAGYPDGLTLEMGASARYDMDKAAAVVQRQLKDAGINVKLVALEKHAFYDATNDWQKPGNFNVFLEAWYGYAAAPIMGVINWRCGEHWNIMKWCNAEFDKALNSVKQIPTREERKATYHEMLRLMHDDYIAVWIDHGATAYAYRADVDLGMPLPNGYMEPLTMKFVE
jgi:peptide/nickel transport system substrate-binding protein